MSTYTTHTASALAGLLFTGSVCAGALTVTTHTSKASFDAAAGATTIDTLDDAALQSAFSLLDRGAYTIDPVGGPWEPVLHI